METHTHTDEDTDHIPHNVQRLRGDRDIHARMCGVIAPFTRLGGGGLGGLRLGVCVDSCARFWVSRSLWAH